MPVSRVKKGVTNCLGVSLIQHMFSYSNRMNLHLNDFYFNMNSEPVLRILWIKPRFYNEKVLFITGIWSEDFTSCKLRKGKAPEMILAAAFTHEASAILSTVLLHCCEVHRNVQMKYELYYSSNDNLFVVILMNIQVHRLQ